jgi:hypothetical protein
VGSLAPPPGSERRGRDGGHCCDTCFPHFLVPNRCQRRSGGQLRFYVSVVAARGPLSPIGIGRTTCRILGGDAWQILAALGIAGSAPRPWLGVVEPAKPETSPKAPGWAYQAGSFTGCPSAPREPEQWPLPRPPLQLLVCSLAHRFGQLDLARFSGCRGGGGIAGIAGSTGLHQAAHMPPKSPTIDDV